jgi:hypothetical protein
VTDHRLDPRGIKPSTTEGDVLQTVGGVAVWAAFALPVAPTPLITVINGAPGFVFDADGQQVYTEGAS